MAKGEAKKLLRVLHGEALDVPPVWLMRQAGRYLPEYRALRARAGGFLDLCFTPELAEEVTLQPIRRFGFDAAILFADILLVPHALGQELSFVEGEGPRLTPPIADRRAFGRLRPAGEIEERLAPVFETVRRLRLSLPGDVALIGFAGAPWTVASYMVAGQGVADQGPARLLMYRDGEAFGQLVDLLTAATVRYLGGQIAAGAEAVMLFDSWAGSLPAPMLERHVIEPARQIVAALRETWPDVPVIGFPRGAGAMYPRFAQATGVAAIGLDSAVPLEWARRVMLDGRASGVALQGNLDPMLLVAGGSLLGETARRMVESMRGAPYVFNLGHGITPEVEPAHVEALLRAVRG
ncbi:MAG TPA: uroporphyrinogen decarboxylase [Thermohalobaculum sp.]|nr:uroporphyrinogen decarboxylase [Thermohalobaculum sp.]